MRYFANKLLFVHRNDTAKAYVKMLVVIFLSSEIVAILFTSLVGAF